MTTRAKSGAPVEHAGEIVRRRRTRVLGSRPRAPVVPCLRCGQTVVPATSPTQRRYVIDPTPVLPGVAMGDGARRLVLWFEIDGVGDPVGEQRVDLAPADYTGRTWVEHFIVCGAGKR